MRQTAHIYMATAVTAFVMCCSLPYATRANLNRPVGLEGLAPYRMSERPAITPVAFIDFPRSIALIPDASAIDLSITAPRAFLALSKNLSVNTKWANASVAVSIPEPAETKIDSGKGTRSVPLTSPIENNAERIAFKTPVLAPMAFLRFCTRYPEDCKVRPTEFENASVPLTKVRLAELIKVNRDVNHTIRPQENVGGVMAEEWLVAPHHGDCNDYAVTKRHQLLAHGWPSHSLLLAEVVVAWGEHHLVLVVRTREDDLVLDNLNQEVRSISQIEYQWVRAQQAENPKFWSAINVTRSDRVAMNAR